jgi:hypothetical protein
MQIHRPNHENCFHPMSFLTTSPPPCFLFSILPISHSSTILFQKRWRDAQVTIQFCKMSPAMGRKHSQFRQARKLIKPLILFHTRKFSRTSRSESCEKVPMFRRKLFASPRNKKKKGTRIEKMGLRAGQWKIFGPAVCHLPRWQPLSCSLSVYFSNLVKETASLSETFKHFCLSTMRYITRDRNIQSKIKFMWRLVTSHSVTIGNINRFPHISHRDSNNCHAAEKCSISRRHKKTVSCFLNRISLFIQLLCSFGLRHRVALWVDVKVSKEHPTYEDGVRTFLTHRNGR